MLSGVEEVEVEEEAMLVLQCDVQANPVVSVSWQQEGSLLDLSKGGFTLTNDGFTTQLTVNRVNRRLHHGTYQCITVSSIYGTSSKLFQVTVNGQYTQPQFCLCHIYILNRGVFLRFVWYLNLLINAWKDKSINDIHPKKVSISLSYLISWRLPPSTEKTLKFPLMPLVAGLVVVACTTLLAIMSRWKKIAKVHTHKHTLTLNH